MSPQFSNMSELLSYLESLENRLNTLESENRVLQDQKEFLTKYIDGLDKNGKAVLPRTNIVSPSYIKRAFAVWGHYFVANLIISIPIACATAVATYFLMQKGINILNYLPTP
jgi:hypothetical protein